MSEEEIKVLYCPVCDRIKPDWPTLKEHVEKAHPEYDPEWANDEIFMSEERKSGDLGGTA